MDFASNLKAFRRKARITQEEVASHLGISRQAVAKWENGSSQPDMQKLAKLAQLLDASIDELVNGKMARGASSAVPASKGFDEMIVNQGLQKAMQSSDPDEEIQTFLAYVGEQLRAERTYIFEKSLETGLWRNTYEWCADGVEPQIDQPQGAPNAGLTPWLEVFAAGRPVYIYDLEDIRESNPATYEWLKPQSITSVVELPLFDGTRAFLGADNPPRAFIKRTASFLETAGHFFESMIRNRDLLLSLRVETEKHSLLYRVGDAIEYTLDPKTGEIELDPSVHGKLRSLSRVTCLDDLRELLKRHPECENRVLVDGIDHVIKSHTGTFIEFVYYDTSTHSRWFKVGLSPVIDAAGTLSQIIGTVEETTLQHEADERYAALNEHFSGGMHVCYLSDPIHLSYASNSLCEMLGYTREEFDSLVGKNYCKAIAPEDRQRFADYAAALGQKEGRETIEYDLVRKDGSILHVLDVMESTLDGNGIMYGYANVMDISRLTSSLKSAHEREDYANLRIARQFEILEALSADYTNVYAVDLNQDIARVLKLNGYVTAGLDEASPDPIPYFEYCKRYVAARVHPKDQKRVLYEISPAKVKLELENVNEYSGSYRVVEDGAVHFCEFKYIRTSSGNSNVLAAFSNIDALMARGAARKKILENEVDTSRALLKIFRSVYRIDLDNSTFTELVSRAPEIHDAIGIGGSAVEAADTLCHLYVESGSSKKLHEFLEISTLAQRLEDRDSISMQACTEYSGWTEFFLIAGKNEDGKLVDVYLATHSIEKQKLHEQKTARALKESHSREKRARIEASRDALTDTLNRRAYENALKDIEPDRDLGVIFCDVNGLKATNDKSGHKMGDELLKRFTRILRGEFSDDVIYRVGGDEFVILIPNIHADSLERRFENLHNRIKAASDIAACGMAWGQRDDFDNLITQAEDNMYAEKTGMKATRL